MDMGLDQVSEGAGAVRISGPASDGLGRSCSSVYWFDAFGRLSGRRR